jgi:SAM-dependent methyltransferase
MEKRVTTTLLDKSTDPHFASADPELLRIWDDLQRWQTDFCFPLELPTYYTSQSWLNANSVLDIGTGNGYYLARLMEKFPDKKYSGIDSSVEFIEIARREHRNKPAFFDCANLFEWTGQYDFVLMRLLLQHVPNIHEALDHAASLTGVGGSALIIDAWDAVRYFSPELPEFTAFFQAFRRHEVERGRNRDAAANIEQAVQNHPQWVVGAKSQILIPSSIPGNRELFRKTYRRVIDMLERAGEMKYDFDSVRRAWDQWCGLSASYTQVGLTLIQLDRQ